MILSAKFFCCLDIEVPVMYTASSQSFSWGTCQNQYRRYDCKQLTNLCNKKFSRNHFISLLSLAVVLFLFCFDLSEFFLFSLLLKVFAPTSGTGCQNPQLNFPHLSLLARLHAPLDIERKRKQFCYTTGPENIPTDTLNGLC